MRFTHASWGCRASHRYNIKVLHQFRSLRDKSILTCAKESSDLAFARVGEQLFDEGTPPEEPRLRRMHLASLTFLVLNVDSIPSRFKETKPAIEQVRIDKLGDQVVDLLHRDFVMDRLCKEGRVAVLKDQLDLYPDSEYQHWH